jgi:nucleoside-diphosphate-sugar epimerase
MPEALSSESLQALVGELGYKIDAIVHCAGLAHGKLPNADYQDYRAANVALTEALAEFSLDTGAKKFVFLSTIGVHGRISSEPVSESSSFSPYDSYSRSKLEAEKRLVELFESQDRRNELVIIRPPLIVGNNAPGNFGKLVRLCALPIPLPFGMIKNKRTVLSNDNLVDFIRYALAKSDVSGVFTLADDEVISTKDIATEIKASLGRSQIMVPVPTGVLKVLLSLLGKPQFYEQLCEDLVIDNTRAKSQGWQPVVTSRETLNNAVRFSAANK